MSAEWDDHLPAEFWKLVASPVEFESQRDESSQSRKTWGFDPQGARCFYQHEFTLSEDRFDVDEFPIRVDVFWEQVTAWRMQDGKWVRVRRWSDSMDSCHKRFTTEIPEVVSESQLQTMVTKDRAYQDISSQACPPEAQ